MNDNKEQLTKLAGVIKRRREALGYSLRDLEKISKVSKSLISKIENIQIISLPKEVTLKLLNDALKFENNELLELANIFFLTEKNIFAPTKNWSDKLRELLATETVLNSKNIDITIAYIQGLLIFQEIIDEKLTEKYPELKDKINKLSL